MTDGRSGSTTETSPGPPPIRGTVSQLIPRAAGSRGALSAALAEAIRNKRVTCCDPRAAWHSVCDVYFCHIHVAVVKNARNAKNGEYCLNLGRYSVMVLFGVFVIFFCNSCN